MSSLIINFQHKTCCRCKKSKEIAFFSKNREAKDGLAHECKACVQVQAIKRNGGRYILLRPLKKAGLKKCPKCREIKNLGDFDNGYCKPCKAKYDRQYQDANRDRINEHNRATGNNSRWRKLWRERNPKKVQAYENTQARKDSHREQQARRSREIKRTLADGYIKGLLTKSNSALRHKDIPQELVELKMMQIKIHREIKNQTPINT